MSDDYSTDNSDVSDYASNKKYLDVDSVDTDSTDDGKQIDNNKEELVLDPLGKTTRYFKLNLVNFLINTSN